ncbi:MAG: YrhB domain-containing protein [Acidimicrobiales bacterium]
MERDDAIAIAEGLLTRISPDQALVVVPDRIRETPDLFELDYDTEAFVRTGDRSQSLVGAGSVIVDRRDGAVVRTGNLFDDDGAEAEILRRHAATPAPEQLSAAADRLWVRLPWTVSRWLTFPGRVLADGRYLASYGPAGVALPLAALVVGLILGARPWTDDVFTYTQSIGIIGALLGLGVLGGALGTWATLGYAVGELVLARTPPLGALLTPGLEGRLRFMWPGWLASYLILLLVVAAAPVLADGARQAVRRRLARLPDTGGVVGDVAFVAATSALVWVWCLSTSYLIRAVFVSRDAAPQLEAVTTVQLRTSGLVLLALLAAAGRVALERVGAAHPVVPRTWAAIVPPPLPQYPAPVAAVGLVVLAYLQTVVLSGLIVGWAQFLGVLVALAAGLLLGRLLLPSTGWARSVRRVPVLVRFVAVVGMAMLAAYPFVARAYEPGNEPKDFLPLLVGIVVSAVAAGVLLPAGPRRRRGLSA